MSRLDFQAQALRGLAASASCSGKVASMHSRSWGSMTEWRDTAHSGKAMWKSIRHVREAFLDIPTQSSHKLKATERPPQNHMEPKTYQAELYPLPYPEDHEKQTTKRPLHPLPYSSHRSIIFKKSDIRLMVRLKNFRETGQPNTPVLLPRKSHGWRSLVGCSPWGHQELDTTEWLHFHFSLSCIGEGNGNPLRCSCLENPRDGGAWWAAVYGVTQSRTQLKWLSSSKHLYVCQ